MIPILALQTAIRSRLIETDDIRDRVDPWNIRTGSIRPEQLPAIVLSSTRSEILGRGANGQIVAKVSQIVHIWAVQDGSGTIETLASAAFVALMDAPATDGFQIDAWDRPHLVWADQSASVGNASHAAISLRATIRWRE